MRYNSSAGKTKHELLCVDFGDIEILRSDSQSSLANCEVAMNIIETGFVEHNINSTSNSSSSLNSTYRLSLISVFIIAVLSYVLLPVGALIPVLQSFHSSSSSNIRQIATFHRPQFRSSSSNIINGPGSPLLQPVNYLALAESIGGSEGKVRHRSANNFRRQKPQSKSSFKGGNNNSTNFHSNGGNRSNRSKGGINVRTNSSSNVVYKDSGGGDKNISGMDKKKRKRQSTSAASKSNDTAAVHNVWQSASSNRKQPTQTATALTKNNSSSSTASRNRTTTATSITNVTATAAAVVTSSSQSTANGRVNYTDLIQRRKPLLDAQAVFKALVPAGGSDDLSKMDKRQFSQQLLAVIPSLSPCTLGDVLLGFGSLKLPTRSKDMVLLSDSLVEQFNNVQRSISGRDFTHCIVGLARLGIRCPNPRTVRLTSSSGTGTGTSYSSSDSGGSYSSIGSSDGISYGNSGGGERHGSSRSSGGSFHDALPRVLPQMDPSELSSTLWAMGKLGMRWDALPLKIHKAIGAAVLRTCTNMSPLCVANTIHGLSNMKAQWQVLPKYLSSALLDSLQSTIPSMQEQETSNCISGLGRLGANWQALPAAVRQSLEQRFLHNIGSLGTKGLAMSVYGLGRMNAELRHLTAPFRDSIMTAIVKIAPSVNAHEASNILYGLGRMGADFSGQRDKRVMISGAARRGLMKALTREAWRMNAQGVSNSLWGLMHMHARWRLFTAKEQDALLLALCREAPRMDEQQVGNTLFSLGHLGLSWKNSMDQETRRILLQALVEVGAQLTPDGVVMTLLGLRKLHLSWQSLPTSLQLRLGDAMEHVLRHASERTLFSIVHALSSLKVQWDELRPSLQTALQESIARTYWATGTAISTSPEDLSSILDSSGRSDATASLGSGFGLLYGSDPTPQSSSSSILSTLNKDYDAGHMNTARTTAVARSPSGAVVATAEAESDANRVSTKDLEQLPSSTAAALLLALPPSEAGTESSHAGRKLLLSELMKSPAVAMSARNRTLIRGSTLVLGAPIVHQPEAADTAPTLVPTRTDIVTASAAAATPAAQGERSTTAAAAEPVLTVSTNTNTFAASHGHYVYYLGQMHARWEEIGISAQIALSASLEKSLPSMTEQGVVNALHGLSIMGCKWHLLSSSLRAALVAALSRVSVEMKEQGVSVAVLSLAKMEACWGADLSEELKSGLRAAIVRQSELSEHALSNLLYGLGRMGRPWEEIHPEVRHTLTEAVVLCHLRGKSSPQGVANNLYGLANMNVGWYSMSSSVRLSLCKELSKVIPRATTSQLSSMLGSLGKMAACWGSSSSGSSSGSGGTHLPEELRRLIWQYLLRKCPTMNEQHISNVLFALGSMGLRWQEIPADISLALSKRLKTLCYSSSSSSVAAATGATTAEESHFQQQRQRELRLPPPPSVANSLLLTAADNKMLTPQGLSMTLVGLNKLGATWSTLPARTCGALEHRIIELLPLMNSVQLARTLAAMAAAMWRWDDLLEDMKKAIITTVPNTIFQGTGNYHDFSVAVHALGNMGLRWEGVERKSEVFITSLYRAMHHLVANGNHEELSGFVLGVAMMDQRWEDIPGRYRKDIAGGILRLFRPSKSSSSLSTQQLQQQASGGAATSATEPFMQHRFTSAVSASRSAADKSFSPNSGRQMLQELHQDVDGKFMRMSRSQAVANLAYGMSLLVFDVRNRRISQELAPVHAALLDAVSQVGVGCFGEVEKEQILIYMHLLQTVLPELSPQQSELAMRTPIHVLRADKPLLPPSKLQESVVKSLRAALQQRNEDLKVADEYSAFDGAFPVDATVFDDGYPVAFVEVDGPQHFHDGVLRRKDKMKEALYRKKHPCATFTRVRFDQVDNLGSVYVGKEIANYITLSLHSCYVDPTIDTCSAAFRESIGLTATTTSAAEDAGSVPPKSLLHLLRATSEEGWTARQALRELNAALEWKKHGGRGNSKKKNLSDVNRITRMSEFILADAEEDNS